MVAPIHGPKRRQSSLRGVRGEKYLHWRDLGHEKSQLGMQPKTFRSDEAALQNFLNACSNEIKPDDFGSHRRRVELECRQPLKAYGSRPQPPWQCQSIAV